MSSSGASGSHLRVYLLIAKSGVRSDVGVAFTPSCNRNSIFNLTCASAASTMKSCCLQYPFLPLDGTNYTLNVTVNWSSVCASLSLSDN